mmetsp:Transcript_8495/g.24443  ORF Transcript_8495/g.24443 Transcript_8495/m.24443 type:complete len:359 (+) Transcript_8495:254-1330(+)
MALPDAAFLLDGPLGLLHQLQGLLAFLAVALGGGEVVRPLAPGGLRRLQVLLPLRQGFDRHRPLLLQLAAVVRVGRNNGLPKLDQRLACLQHVRGRLLALAARRRAVRTDLREGARLHRLPRRSDLPLQLADLAIELQLARGGQGLEHADEQAHVFLVGGCVAGEQLGLTLHCCVDLLPLAFEARHLALEEGDVVLELRHGRLCEQDLRLGGIDGLLHLEAAVDVLLLALMAPLVEIRVLVGLVTDAGHEGLDHADHVVEGAAGGTARRCCLLEHGAVTGAGRGVLKGPGEGVVVDGLLLLGDPQLYETCRLGLAPQGTQVPLEEELYVQVLNENHRDLDGVDELCPEVVDLGAGFRP